MKEFSGRGRGELRPMRGGLHHWERLRKIG